MKTKKAVKLSKIQRAALEALCSAKYDSKALWAKKGFVGFISSKQHGYKVEEGSWIKGNKTWRTADVWFGSVMSVGQRTAKALEEKGLIIVDKSKDGIGNIRPSAAGRKAVS